MTENLPETTVKKMKKGNFRLTCVAQKRCCLRSLLSVRVTVIATKGSLSNDDGEGNENGKRAIGQD